VRRVLYGGDYERVVYAADSVREFYNLGHDIIAVRLNGGPVAFYMAQTDHHGSIISVRDSLWASKFHSTYDAWGKQSAGQNAIGLLRGYTGHEMLPEYGLINMNGRLYDPQIGRFLSPDNYVQLPDLSQSFNRYSYCLNNPLKYTDPDGNLFGIDDAVIAYALFNMANSMMQAAYYGESIWKAGGLSLLSSAASYGIGSAFGGVGSYGKEMLRAGAHGLASGTISAMNGGNFVSSFISGAAASGIGSFSQSVNMNPDLMLASTTAMGGLAAWATGGDIIQGAMQGLTIGAFNHNLHDGGYGRTPLKVSVTTNEAGTYEFIVVGAKSAVKTDALAIASGMNTVFNSTGKSLKVNGGNSTLGSNHRFYWHASGERGFYGNQYVSTVKLATIGKYMTKATGHVGGVLDAYKIYSGYSLDGGQIGYNTVRASADAFGGWAGAWAGLKAGGLIGGSIGSVPGAIIGGVIGGVGGAYAGSYVGTFSVDWIYGL